MPLANDGVAGGTPKGWCEEIHPKRTDWEAEGRVFEGAAENAKNASQQKVFHADGELKNILGSSAGRYVCRPNRPIFSSSVALKTGAIFYSNSPFYLLMWWRG